MNIDNLKNTWKQQDSKHAESIKINTQKLNQQRLSQTEKLLSKLLVKRVIEALLFFMIIVLLWQYIVAHFSINAPTLSAFVLTLFSIVGLASNIGQITLLCKVDLTKPINTVQRQIFDVKHHKVVCTKLILLSIPLYMAYVFLFVDVFFGFDLYLSTSQFMKNFYIATAVFIYIPILYIVIKLRRENINTPWVAMLMTKFVGTELLKLAKVINQLEDKS